VFSFGGDNGSGSDEVGMVEKINFSDPIPAWQRLSDLVLPATQNNMVILPDGKLLVVGGRGAGVNTLHYQMFDPADGSRTDLIESSVPRHDHSTALLQPNGGVWVMGGNRYVELPFEAGEHGRLDVMAPPLPGLAIAGDYLLFVVNKDGVPSEGKHIRLRPSDEQLEDEDDHDHGA